MSKVFPWAVLSLSGVCLVATYVTLPQADAVPFTSQPHAAQFADEGQAAKSCEHPDDVSSAHGECARAPLSAARSVL